MEQLQIRVTGDAVLPTIVYLPGLHGDWTLIASFRAALAGRARLVEITYPRSLTWAINDYAAAIAKALEDEGIGSAWLLGESFGSQVAWELLGSHNRDQRFTGVILAGGFVKHPISWGPAILRWICRHSSPKRYQRQLKIYAWYARFRHRRAPEILASIREFVARRTELDREAMNQRLHLIDSYDARSIARLTQLPVYYLAGLVDPLVPFPIVRWWLRKHCPGYRHGKTFWLADHNVLATAPMEAARQVLSWIASEAKEPTLARCSRIKRGYIAV